MAASPQLTPALAQWAANAPTAAADSLGGYASRVSVAAGEQIDFHLSTDWGAAFDLPIWREGATRTWMTSVRIAAPGLYNCTGGYATGCNWPVAASLVIPVDWPSGIYTADVPSAAGAQYHLIFHVRAATPGATGKLLFISSTNTWQAYNNYGGKGLYDDISTDGIRSPRVSYSRPYVAWNGFGEFPRWEAALLKWLETEGYAVEYATTYDAGLIPTLFDNYDVVMAIGHSEYWSWPARQQLTTFIANGGRYLNLSGNTMWWQVRIEDNGRTLVGYKDYRTDPEKSRELATYNPWNYPILDSPYALNGGHWPQGGYPFSANFSLENGYGGYQVQQADHWVFAGAGLVQNAMFGRGLTKTTSILDHEIDGSSFNCGIDGYSIISPLAHMGVPRNFTILGAAPAYISYLGFGTMGIATNEQGGAIFSVNTTGWSNALFTDPAVAQITRNVLDRFLDQQTPLPQEADALDAHLLFYDRFNCSNLAAQWPTPHAPEWQSLPAHNYFTASDRQVFQYDEQCGISGSGLRLPINTGNNRLLSVMLKPNWEASSTLHSSTYVDLSNLTLADGDAFDLLRMGYDTLVGGGALEARLEIRRSNNDYFMSHTVANHPADWVMVPKDEPFLVKTVWDQQENVVALWVNGYRYDQAVTINNNAKVNRIELGLYDVGGGASGFVCVDEFTLHDEEIHNPLYGVLALDTPTVGGGTVRRIPEKPRYGDGETVTLVAEPLLGWTFTGWQGIVAALDTSSTPTTTMTIESNRVVTATFTQLLTLTTEISGQGEIRSSEPLPYVAPGAVVTLTAEAAVGWHFVEWQGAATGSTVSIQVTMDANKTVTAVFESLIALAINVEGQGTITRNPEKQFYEPGELVTLTTEPADGWHFVGWEGLARGTEPSVQITVAPNQPVTARFAENTHTLSVTKVGSGTVTQTPNLAAYSPNQEVTLTAQPATGWRFVEWRGAVTESNATVSIFMDSDKTVTAVFEELLPLNLTINGQGAVTRSPNKTLYQRGEQVQLTAQPATGWSFGNWQGAVNSTNATIVITMAPDQAITATFVENGYALTVGVEGQGTVQQTPEQATYTHGQTVTLTAQAATGWQFSHWSGTAVLLNASAPTQTITMTQPVTAVAHFTEKAPETHTIYLPLINQ
jgi:hypothetical protein